MKRFLSRKFVWYGIGSLILLLAISILLSIQSSNSPPSIKIKSLDAPASGGNEKTKSRTRLNQVTTNNEIRGKEPQTAESVVQRLLDQRSQLSSQFTGSQLLEEQIKFNGKVVEKLSGVDLLEYFKRLHEIGAGKDFDLTMAVAIGKAFGANTVEESLEWLAKNGDPEFLSKIAYSVGEAYYPDDLETAMAAFKTPDSKAKLLSGKCAQIAVYDLPLAMRTFIANRPSSVDFSDMKGVFNMTRSDADFIGANDLIPSDAQTIASDVRGALFKRWAEYRPREVAEFIIKGNDKVSISQLSPIVKQWFETNPQETLEWVNSMNPDASKDLGLQALVDPLMRNSPSSAWDLAVQIGDSKKRDEALKKVHAVWIKIDPESAEAARNKISATSSN